MAKSTKRRSSRAKSISRKVGPLSVRTNGRRLDATVHLCSGLSVHHGTSVKKAATTVLRILNGL